MVIDLSLLQEDEDMEDVEADETEAGESSKAAVRDKVPQVQTVVQAELKSHKMHEQDVDELAEDIQSALPCSTPSLTDLERMLLNFVRDINAKVCCKWYRPLMTGSTQVKHHGKFAYTLPVREEEDCKTVDNGLLVTAVRMVPDETMLACC